MDGIDLCLPALASTLQGFAGHAKLLGMAQWRRVTGNRLKGWVTNDLSQFYAFTAEYVFCFEGKIF